MSGTIFVVNSKETTLAEIVTHLKNDIAYNVVLNTDVGVDVNKIASIKAYFSTVDDLKAVIIPEPEHMGVSIEDTTDEQFEQAFNSGALIAMLMTHAAGEYFREKGNGGVIIYLGSIHTEKPTGGDFLFSIQCSATQLMCREAVIAYGKYNVNCFYIQRGIMDSDIEDVGVISNIYSSTGLRYPKMRAPSSDSLNGLIDFLLTEAASPLSGSDLKADEGLTMYYGNRGDRQ
jgi:hypothetical protein